jgi:glyoxylase-like metal-dependent hydrolase (beta-lactamase superfamily II)
MRVTMLDAGWISSAAAVFRQGEDPESRISFPIPAFLIETGEERILVDTGLHPQATADPAAFYERPEAGIFELALERPVLEQVDPATLTRVVLTHLHFDHAGALTMLPGGVPVVLQRREWQAAHEREAVARNFFYPRDYAVEEDDLVLVDGDHDLLGDGSVQLLLTPGHTPGHQSVKVGEDLVIGADVGHFAATLDDLRFPSWADDFDAQRASAARLRALRDSGVTVLPGHDREVLQPGPVTAGATAPGPA